MKTDEKEWNRMADEVVVIKTPLKMTMSEH